MWRRCPKGRKSEAEILAPLKGNSDADLRSVQCYLIKKVVGTLIAEIIVEIAITNLGKDVTGDLAA